jgi:transcriptional regulator GlxA family with amidase domain
VDDLARRFPKIQVQADALFTRDGAIYTSAGVTAGIDLSLSLVEADLGRKVALGVARDLVVYLKRSGGQMQFSEPLQFQIRASDRFADLADWMLRNLRNDLSIEKLAARIHLSPRQFSRRFKATFGMTPADYVERLRLDDARRRLSSSSPSLESIALSVGYTSADAFRRAFERNFGVAPSDYRRQFPAR